MKAALTATVQAFAKLVDVGIERAHVAWNGVDEPVNERSRARRIWVFTDEDERARLSGNAIPNQRRRRAVPVCRRARGQRLAFAPLGARQVKSRQIEHAEAPIGKTSDPRCLRIGSGASGVGQRLLRLHVASTSNDRAPARESPCPLRGSP